MEMDGDGMLGSFFTHPLLALSFVCGGGGEVFQGVSRIPDTKKKATLLFLFRLLHSTYFHSLFSGVLYYGHFSAWLEWAEFLLPRRCCWPFFFLCQNYLAFFFFYTTTFQDINHDQNPDSYLRVR